MKLRTRRQLTLANILGIGFNTKLAESALRAICAEYTVSGDDFDRNYIIQGSSHEGGYAFFDGKGRSGLTTGFHALARQDNGRSKAHIRNLRHTPYGGY